MQSFSKGYFIRLNCAKALNERIISRSNWEIFRFGRQKAGKPLCRGCFYLNLAYDRMSHLVFISAHFYELHTVQPGLSPTWKTFYTPACHLVVPSSISPQVSELQFPKHSRNPFSPLFLCFPTRLCSFSDAWCFIEYPAEWRDSINICREDERTRTRQSAAVSAALGWTLGLLSSILYQEDLYFGLSQSWFSCL